MSKWNRGRFFRHKSRDGIAEMVQRAHRVEEQTNAEAMYLTRLIQNKTPITVKLVSEEEISGWIEYYDKTFIRITRHNAPNAFIFKDQIKFIMEGRRG
jgi:hypothetical protein